ncbi:MAG: DNA methyltransferase [Acidimicrobiia bacterium]
MSRLSNLLREVEEKDPQLAADLRREVEALSRRRAFGLSFERHIPETVELPGRPVRRGDKVRFLPYRGQAPSSVDRRLWRVAAIRRTDDGRVADLVRRDDQDDEPVTISRSLDDLVVVAEFRDPVYPGLVSTGKIEHGGDKPFHTVINAENYHALQALLYTHEGKIDAIYIDPPYNSGARDWKYNNDYVDSDDAYRHSKWLAMMERRLKLAKRLLNPNDSVLIVTIDEREYLRLGLLLEQMFPDAAIQMVSTVINRKGNPRRGEFSRCEEYLFFVRYGGATISAGQSDMLSQDAGNAKEAGVRWKSLLRLASTGQTSGRFNLFYPLYFEEKTRRFLRAGDPLPEGVDIGTVVIPPGETILWPISKDGNDGRWSLSVEKLHDYLERGYVRFGQPNGGGRTPYYLMSGQIDAIASGDLVATGRDSDGAVVLQSVTPQRQPLSVWNQQSHSTSGHGTAMLRDLIPGRKFPYPKSLYAVEDALRFAVGAKPEALVLDFFSGSGTTSHAVMRLNRQDGGRRRSIMVTNNEVAGDEQRALQERGLRPGDPDWERWGICDYITKPRVAAAITGHTPEGEPIQGDYRFTDEFPIADGFEENVEYFTMTYEAPRPVAHNRSFEAVAPLLWLKAGSVGRRIDKVADGFDVADTYGVLFDLDASQKFLFVIADTEAVRMAFIVTDDDRGFQMVCADLPAQVEPVRLYESYLTNFTINTSRD